MRKGQAALEYIVTYGWGFIVILVVIGALAYFGFLNPSRYVPSRCNFGAQLECVDYKLESSATQNGKVYLSFRNNFGDAITITNIYTLRDDRLPMLTGSGQVINKSAVTTTAISVQLPDDDPVFLVKDDKTSVQLIIEFRRNPAIDPSSLLHNVTGEIYTTVQ